MSHDEAKQYALEALAQALENNDGSDEMAWIEINRAAQQDDRLAEAFQLVGFRRLLGEQNVRH